LRHIVLEVARKVELLGKTMILPESQDELEADRIHWVRLKVEGKTSPSEAREQNPCVHLQPRQKRGPQARGNPDGLSVCFAISEN
jgi:hypothetical protein